MKILFVCLYFPPARSYGGPLVSALAICRAWRQMGFDVEVLTTNADGPGGKISAGSLHLDGLDVYYAGTIGELFSPWWPALFLSRVWRFDLVYVWGIMVWLLPLITVACRILGKRLIVSPRGMLFDAALGRGSLRKRLFLLCLRAVGMPRVATLHATSLEEAARVSTVFPGARVIVVPNGVDVPSLECDLPSGRRYVLFLGRIDPIKRIELLLRSFAAVRPELRREYQLRVVGEGDQVYLGQLQRLSDDLRISGSVEFSGPVAGEAKNALLRGAQVLVLPSASENFGMAVAEALAHGTPVIASVGTPWSGVVERRCGWWVNGDVEPMAAALQASLQMSDEDRSAMGLRGRTWMKESFSWVSAATALIRVDQ